MFHINRSLVMACAATAAILASPAFAQDRDVSSDRFHDMHMRGWDGGDRAWSGNDRRDWRSDDGSGDRWFDRQSRSDDEDRGPGMNARGGHPWRSGASFMLRSGDMRLAVRCGAEESMRACVEATTTLLDKARAAAEAAGRTGPATTPGTSP